MWSARNTELTSESVEPGCQPTTRTKNGQLSWLEHTKLAGQSDGVAKDGHSDVAGDERKFAKDHKKESLGSNKLKSGRKISRGETTPVGQEARKPADGPPSLKTVE